MKRIHVISDGTRKGTHVKNAQTGEEVCNLTAIGLFLTADDETPRAHLTMLAPTIDAICELEEVQPEWIDIRAGNGYYPAPGTPVWAASPGMVQVAMYQGEAFWPPDGTPLPIRGVTHWQPAAIPEHPIEQDSDVYAVVKEGGLPSEGTTGQQ